MQATQSMASGPILSLDAYARLAAAGVRRSFPTGAALTKQGDIARSLFVILTGHVRVLREHADFAEPMVLSDLGPGELVGEIGVLDGMPRSATVVAMGPTIAAEVSAEALARLVDRFPTLYGDLVALVSRRLRAANVLAASQRQPELA